MSDQDQELKPEDGEAGMQIGQKRQNTENGGPASKKANITEAGTLILGWYSFITVLLFRHSPDKGVDSLPGSRSIDW